jgi:predicted RNA-binding protein with PIN domain
MYIIDANNLAGKLKMLGEENFDKKLINMIREFNRDRGVHIFLVFDGANPFGDKVSAGHNLSVVYSPKDIYYQSADDKIVEMVRGSWLNEDFAGGKTITVVTDDRELRKRIEAAAAETRYNIKLERATDWAEKILNRLAKYEYEDEIEDRNKGGLSDEEVDDINNELYRAWK